MRELIYFESEDGELFLSKEECMAWEYKFNHLPKSIQWWDKDGNELIPNTCEEIEEAYNKVGFAEVKAIDGWEDDLVFMEDYFGYMCEVVESGKYKWDDSQSRFILCDI